MSSADRPPTSARARTILLIAGVLVLAVVAAVGTWVFSARTHEPTPRELSPQIQVAAGSEHVDPVSGVVVRVPEGWRVQEGDLVFGTTALVPDESVLGTPGEDPGPGSLVLVGAMGPELFADQAADPEQAAAVLASGMGEFFLPVPGERTDVRSEAVSSRFGDGWAVSYRVVPSEPGMLGPEGALVYAAVMSDGAGSDDDGDAGAFWLTYIGSPADGSMASPDERWADRIAERLRPAD